MRTTQQLPLATASVSAVLMLSACSADPATTQSPEAEGTADSGAAADDSEAVGGPDEVAEPQVVAEDLGAPWSIAFHGDVPLVSERDTARILELGEDGTPREVGEVPGVQAVGEGGLLGIAVHGEFLYAYSTGASENRIELYEITGEPGGLGLGEGETVLAGIPAAGNHNGGRVAFGPDGMLYATAGDAGDTDNAQDLESLAGKILRLTPAGEVPEDNPFDGSPVYSYGHRNPQGLAWADDGTLYASEFGQDTWDELNVIEPGADYGWPEVEGIAEEDGFTDPVQQWEPAEASPSGLAIAGESLWIANLRGTRLHEVPLGDLSESTEHLVGEHGRLRDVAQAPDGTLWVLTNNTDGRGDPGPGDDRVLSIDPS